MNKVTSRPWRTGDACRAVRDGKLAEAEIIYVSKYSSKASIRFKWFCDVTTVCLKELLPTEEQDFVEKDILNTSVKPKRNFLTRMIGSVFSNAVTGDVIESPISNEPEVLEALDYELQISRMSKNDTIEDTETESELPLAKVQRKPQKVLQFVSNIPRQLPTRRKVSTQLARLSAPPRSTILSRNFEARRVNFRISNINTRMPLQLEFAQSMEGNSYRPEGNGQEYPEFCRDKTGNEEQAFLHRMWNNFKQIGKLHGKDWKCWSKYWTQYLQLLNQRTEDNLTNFNVAQRIFQISTVFVVVKNVVCSYLFQKD